MRCWEFAIDITTSGASSRTCPWKVLSLLIGAFCPGWEYSLHLDLIDGRSTVFIVDFEYFGKRERKKRRHTTSKSAIFFSLSSLPWSCQQSSLVVCSWSKETLLWQHMIMPKHANEFRFLRSPNKASWYYLICVTAMQWWFADRYHLPGDNQ